MSAISVIFYFGETVKEYDVKVLNEREIRASAGILFLFAIISFLNSWLVGDFVFTRIFVVVFLVDFAIRIFVNPKYSPSLIIGRFMVRNQNVEYVGAPQKKLAWAIGFALAVMMFYLLVVKETIGPINLFGCLACLLFLFFESSFGICIGCQLYNVINKEKAKLCPGNSCTIEQREEIQRIDIKQMVIVIFYFILIYVVFTSFITTTDNMQNTTPINTSNKECVAPQWAISMGHEEKWKLHNCK